MQKTSLKKILFTLLASSYLLVADALPTSITTTISKVTQNGEIQLATNVPAGMSGIIVHNYGNGLSAITHASLSQGEGKAKLTPYTAILHKNIPNIQTEALVGDKVIFGNFYDNALLIAPNQKVYRSITKAYKKTWLHPDAYALNFMQDGETELSMEHLQNFAEHNQVGLVLFAMKNSLLILDPISQQFIGNIPLQISTDDAMAPFYARFKQMDVSTFGFSDKNYTPYYQSISGLK